MDQGSGFHLAEPQVISQPAFISPSDCGRLGPVGGRAGVFSWGEGIDKVGESIAGDGDAGEERRSAADGTDVEEVRQLRAPLVPGRPAKKEIEDHSFCHWPCRAWCRHCVRGRAQGSPHRTRSELDRKHSLLGHPTISPDHCFLGSACEDETALGSPFLVLVDNASEAIYMRFCAPRKVASLGLLNTSTVLFTSWGIRECRSR